MVALNSQRWSRRMQRMVGVCIKMWANHIVLNLTKRYTEP